MSKPVINTAARHALSWGASRVCWHCWRAFGYRPSKRRMRREMARLRTALRAERQS